MTSSRLHSCASPGWLRGRHSATGAAVSAGLTAGCPNGHILTTQVIYTRAVGRSPCTFLLSPTPVLWVGLPTHISYTRAVGRSPCTFLLSPTPVLWEGLPTHSFYLIHPCCGKVFLHIPSISYTRAVGRSPCTFLLSPTPVLWVGLPAHISYTRVVGRSPDTFLLSPTPVLWVGLPAQAETDCTTQGHALVLLSSPQHDRLRQDSDHLQTNTVKKHPGFGPTKETAQGARPAVQVCVRLLVAVSANTALCCTRPEHRLASSPGLQDASPCLTAKSEKLDTSK